MKQILISNIDKNWPAIEIEYDKPVDLFIDSFMGFDNNKNSYKILWVKEAEAISGFKKLAIDNHKYFDAILTYDEDILNICNNSHMMLFGTSWVHNYKITKKEFSISHLTGHKNWTIGHKIRQEIYKRQNEILISKNFYISSYGTIINDYENKILLDKKEPLFNSEFHICIENSIQKNYFTEKLIDCLITKTIPIYFGCPNIGDFFDTRGMFIAHNTDEVIQISNSLNDKTYKKMLSFIERNYILAKPFVTITDRLKNLLEHKILI